MTKKIGIIHFTAPPIVGGVESTIYHHARMLIEAGYQVKVIAGRGGDIYPGVEFQAIDEVDSSNPNILEAGKQLSQGIIGKEFIAPRDVLINKLRITLNHIDVCIAHNVMTLHKNLPLTAALHSLVSEGCPPLIAWSHDFAWQDNLYLPDLHPGYPWDLLRNPWEGVRYVVVSAHSRARLAQLLDLPESAIQVIHPGVEPATFLKLAPLTQEITNRLHLLEAEPLILLPARITRRKNIEFAIQVCAALKNSKPDVTLVVTGPPGPHNPTNIVYLQFLEQLIKDLGVADQVHFLYRQSQSDQPLYLTDELVADFFRLADLLFFPSQREGFGIPILEAGLARLPIFAADIPTFRESAGSLATFFDPDDDPDKVAAMIANHLQQDTAYQLRHRILRNYSWQSILETQLIPLIEETCNVDRQATQTFSNSDLKNDEQI